MVCLYLVVLKTTTQIGSSSHHKSINWSPSKKKKVLGLSEEFRRIFRHTNVQVIFKGTNTLKSILMYPKDKIPLHLKQNVVCQWSCPEESYSQSYIGESSRSLENRVKKYSSHVTIAIYIHSETNNQPNTNISHFRLIDQDNK